MITWWLHTLVALPTVVVGLGLYFLLSASGPFGWMQALSTRGAMICDQSILALPIVAVATLTAVRGLRPQAAKTSYTLGLPGLVRMRALLGEVRPAVVSALWEVVARAATAGRAGAGTCGGTGPPAG